MAQPLVNKVAQKPIVTIDLEKLLPAKNSITHIDLKDFLFKELLLKEKDFRDALKAKDWSEYQAKHVAIYCSTDAIIPRWAPMLVATYLQGIADGIYHCSPQETDSHIALQLISNLDLSPYQDQRTIIKGCSNRELSEAVYVRLTERLQTVAKAIMYGEPCSTVPVWRR